MENRDVFNKLAAAEEEFYKSEFLCPVLARKPVRVRIANIIMNFEITKPKNFEGWGVFAPITSNQARRVRTANLKEREKYLALFPSLKLILCRKTEKYWYGIAANGSDTRFKVEGLVPIYLPQEVQLFNTVCTAFDGENCWFDSIDSRHNLRSSAYLRDCINKECENAKLDLSGLTLEERRAYDIAFIDLIESKKDRTEEWIKKQIEHLGGQYKSYVERGDMYTVEYVVDGHAHKSTVNKNLQVQTAGICLNGGDRNFDLNSLIGVLREGQSGRGRGHYHDDRYDEDDY